MNMKQARKRMDDAQQAATRAVDTKQQGIKQHEFDGSLGTRFCHYRSKDGQYCAAIPSAEIHNVQPKQQMSDEEIAQFEVEVKESVEGFIQREIDPFFAERAEQLKQQPSEKVTIVKCPCAHDGCHYYGLSDGVFYQGNGWTQERAQQYADAINSHAALVEALREIADHPHCSYEVSTVQIADGHRCAAAIARVALLAAGEAGEE